MKKITYYILLSGILIYSCSSGYTINGTVEKQDQGEAFITKEAYNGTNDTLAKAKIENGKFTLSGKVDGPTIAYLAVSNRIGAILYLENKAVYQVTSKPREACTVEGGGKDQQLSSDYIQLNTKLYKELQKLGRGFAQAGNSGDTLKRNELLRRQKELIENTELAKKQFLEKHGNSFFVLHDLARRALGMGIDEVKVAFNRCSDELKATEPGRYIISLLPKLAKIAIGATVPDFTSTTPEGKKISLFGIKAKVKLIDFWSSTCGLCRRENRHYLPIYEKYHSQGFEIVAYSFDKKRDLWLKAMAEDGMPWTQVSDLSDPKMKVVKENYGVWSLPANLLVDENNQVIARKISSEELKELLPKLLRK